MNNVRNPHLTILCFRLFLVIVNRQICKHEAKFFNVVIISILAIFSGPRLVKESCHLLSTVRQTQTIIVRLPVV